MFLASVEPHHILLPDLRLRKYHQHQQQQQQTTSQPRERKQKSFMIMMLVMSLNFRYWQTRYVVFYMREPVVSVDLFNLLDIRLL